MLAKEADLSKVGFPQIAQPKLDGIRASVVDGKLVSRTLKPIPNASIREALERPEYEGFDGELIVGDPLAPDCYRTTCSFVMAPNKTGEPWAFHVFDLWNETTAYSLRAARLVHRLSELLLTGDAPVLAVESRAVHSLAELEAVEVEWLAQGHGGRDPPRPRRPLQVRALGQDRTAAQGQALHRL
jgi:DNA ligase-1